MSISSCPACSKQVTIPAGVGTTAKVRCPLCHSQYSLADALVNMPPLLELVDDAPADWPELPGEPPAGESTVGLAADATLDYLPEPADAAEQDSSLVANAEHDETSNEENDTEIEELGFIASEPLVRHAPADDEPIEMAGAGDDSVLDFEAEIEPDEEAGSPPSLDTGPAEEEISLDFGEIAPVEEEVASEADSPGEQTVEGEELVFDLDESESAPAPAADLDRPTAGTQETGDEIELDFGEPLAAESEAAPPDADALADKEEAADDSKGKKKKKKKSREPKAPAEPGRRRSLSSVLGVVMAAVVALSMTLYGVLWINPDYDFFKIGSILPKSLLPAAMSRPKYVAAKPPIPLQPGALSQLPPRRSQKQAAETEQPADPAADAPPVVTPAETPVAPEAADAQAEPSAAGPSLDPDTSAPPPTEPALPLPTPSADEPAAPDATPPVAPITDNPPAADKPEVMPEKPAAPPADDANNELPAPAPGNPAADSPAKPDDAPSPFDDAKPTPPPAEPESTEGLGPAGAAEFSVADLAKAMEVAQAADEKMDAAQGSNDAAELKKARSNFYLSVFRLAEAVTFVKDDAAAGQLDDMRHELVQVVEQFATDAKRVEALKFNAARWLDYPKRTTSGIVLAGNVVSAQRVGKLHEIKLGIGLESDAPIVTVLAARDPALSAGDQAFVLGGIVENPQQQLAGYQGNEATVVWGGQFVKASAEK